MPHDGHRRPHYDKSRHRGQEQLHELLFQQSPEGELQRRAEEITAQQHEERHVVSINKTPNRVVPIVVPRELFHRMPQQDAANGKKLQEIKIGDTCF